MTGSKNPKINQYITKANEEMYFYYTMNDLEELLDQYGAAFVLKNCMIPDMKLLSLYDALNDYFTVKLNGEKK